MIIFYSVNIKVDKRFLFGNSIEIIFICKFLIWVNFGEKYVCKYYKF